MHVLSPQASSASSADPFQLERLAEELASRELSHPAQADLQDGASHDLPIYIPLSHENPFLSAENFDVEEFLLSRSHTSLQDLRTELRNYLATLKEELVKLINDDYEAFISLSTDLREEGDRLVGLKIPLSALKSQIAISKAELRAIQNEIMQKLEQRTVIREEKALLHLLLKISESVTRLESLLSITNPSQDEETIEYERFKVSSISTSLENTDERSIANKAKHLNRAAVEYTQLLYHASKARSENCAFVDEIQWKIDRIQSSLSSDLDALFASTLSAIAGDVKLSELEKSKILPDLTECIRTYDVLGLWRDAEEILRSEVMRPFIRKTVFTGALSAPHSPLLPHTPFRSSMGTGFPHSSSTIPPRTPFTPFTAFSTQQSAFPSALGKTKSPYSRLLDNNDDPLAKLYTQILRFVERDFSSIMDTAEKVCIKSRASTGPLQVGGLENGRNRDGVGFDIMANVIWHELGKAIMDDLGGMVFASGRPDEFRKNYEITQAFIRSLDFMAPSAQAVQSMRSHPVYSMFEKRWQLPVYFQMRWKEIVSKVEEALALPVELSDNLTMTADSLITPQATAIWVALTACWSAEIYIPELSYRFWRLTLQLLSRYRVWLNDVVQDNIHGFLNSSNTINTGKISEANTRSPTPGLSEKPSIEAFAADESTLVKYVSFVADIKTLQSSTMTLWHEEICMMLPDPDEQDEQEEEPKPQDALENAVGAISALIIPISNTIIAILTERCIVSLNAVKKIRTDLRAKANKQLPTEPHPWIPSILRPLKVFFGTSGKSGVGAVLKAEYLVPWSSRVFENVCEKYIAHVSTLKKAEESLRRLKRGAKSTTFSLFGSANPKDDEGRDEERIRIQLILDVEALRKDAETLGIIPGNSEAFTALSNLVQNDEPQESS
ncbi:COG complex component [Lentinula aciculospora]|uniref:Conserved oligomeric Golgi complex subunit 2 n=1 Tax=Lentinula aciculospora TaxID=153920 RepID=A0A9W9AJV8_9AGAR|nr:COG complex component [Lentinula aciculospora]